MVQRRVGLTFHPVNISTPIFLLNNNSWHEEKSGTEYKTVRVGYRISAATSLYFLNY